MMYSVIITYAFFGALLLTILAHTWRAGAFANRRILITLTLVLAILTLNG